MKVSLFGKNINVGMALIFVAIGLVVGCFFICACNKEGMANLSEQMWDSVKQNPAVWDIKKYNPKKDDDSLGWRQLAPDTQMSSMVSPEQMFFFDKTAFSPTCCPASYSNASGCSCLNAQQINYLNERGGNRTCSSDY